MVNNVPNSCTEPKSITEFVTPDFVEFTSPNCLGARWTYPQALALSLQEFEPHIVSGLSRHGLDHKGVIFHTTVKDGCDGMGEVSIYKEKDCKTLPDKAFRFSFCIVKVQAEFENEMYDIFTEPSYK